LGGDGGSGIVVIAYPTSSVSSSGPTNQTAFYTQTATFSVNTSGSVGTLSFQWQINTGSGWSNVSGGSGANTNSYTTPTLALSDDGNQYRVQITSTINGTTATASSSVATLTVDGYDITWDANGGSLAGGEASQFPPNGTIAKPSDPTKSNFNFLGWSTTETSNNGDSGTSVSFPYSPSNNDLVLYAEWGPEVEITTPTTGLAATYDELYNLSISTAEGTGGNSFSATGLGSGLSINSSTGVISGTPTAAGSLTVSVTVEDSVGDTATTSSFTITISQKTLGDASVPTVAAPVGQLKQIAASWDAVANASSYTVTLYDASDNELYEATGVSGTSTTLDSSQYAFQDDTEYKVSVTAIGTGNYQSSAESALSSAVSTNKTYTVTFNKGDFGTGSDQTDTKVTGATLVLPDSDTVNGWFTRTGRTVSGFATNSDGTGTTYAFGANYTADADEILYPVWSQRQVQHLLIKQRFTILI
jgi:uncharacterized repeat protein (TIGR02543 family)